MFAISCSVSYLVRHIIVSPQKDFCSFFVKVLESIFFYLLVFSKFTVHLTSF